MYVHLPHQGREERKGGHGGRGRGQGLTKLAQDLEEVEEWNEYGELKDHVGTIATQPATPTPSAANTPSKAPAATAPPIETPSKPPPSPLSSTPKQNPSTSVETPPPRPPPQTATESPLTTAMRQAGFEAAKKAGDAKKAKLFSSSKEPEKLEGRGKMENLDGVDESTLKKLDNAGADGLAPPSGSTEAEDAKEPETAGADVVSKADDIPAVEEDEDEEQEPGGAKDGTAGHIENLKDEGTDLPLRQAKKDKEQSGLGYPHGTLEPVVAAAGQQSETARDLEVKDTKPLEADGGLEEAINKREDGSPSDQDNHVDPDESDDRNTNTQLGKEDGGSEKTLPGKKTQDQEAAKGEEAGVSVGD